MKKALIVLLLGGTTLDANERTFEFTYNAELDVPEGASKVQMWLPYPTRGDYQDVRLISIESPVPTKVYQEYTYRNSMLFLTTAPGELEKIRVEMSFRITRRAHVEDEFVELEDPEGYIESSARQWLRPDGTEPISDSVRELAEEITEGASTFVQRARAIYDYVVEDTTGEADLTTLARAAGIPARLASGFQIPRERGQGEIREPRRWAELYIPGFGWVPVDTFEARANPEQRDYYFGAHDENRVEFTVGRAIVLNPKQRGEPLPFFIYPYAEIDGKPVRGIRTEFFYKDLELVAE